MTIVMECYVTELRVTAFRLLSLMMCADYIKESDKTALLWLRSMSYEHMSNRNGLDFSELSMY